MSVSPRSEPGAAPRVVRPSSLPIVLIGGALIVGLAALLPILQNSSATSTAGSINRLEQERQDWLARLHEQEIRVAQLGSLDRIEEDAIMRLKMVKPREVIYIGVDAPAPEPHRLPARFLPEAPDSDGGGSSLVGDLIDWLPLP